MDHAQDFRGFRVRLVVTDIVCSGLVPLWCHASMGLLEIAKRPALALPWPIFTLVRSLLGGSAPPHSLG